jgi:WD40 repeat protein
MRAISSATATHLAIAKSDAGEGMTTADVFISYAREDHATAKRLAAALTATRGWSVWWDVRIRTGDPFPREIQQALAQARCVVVLWSAHSIESNWVVAEVSEGWKRGVLAPVLIDACKPPMPFRQVHNADLTGWAGSERDARFLALVEDIQRIMARGAVVDPAELQERAARQRRVQRLRALKWVGLGASVLAGIGVAAIFSWLSLHKAQDTRFGEELLAKAERMYNQYDLRYDHIRGFKKWVWLITDESPELVPTLELSALLTMEGLQRGANEARATRMLERILPLLPWSDRAKVIDNNGSAGALDFNGDGTLLAAGGCGPTLVWDLRADKIIGRIDHGNGRQACSDNMQGVPSWGGPAFSPSSDILATAGPDATARLWTPEGRELRQLRHERPVTDVHFSPDGKAVITTDQGGGVRVWDAGTGRELRRVQHDDWAYGAVLSPSGKYLGTGSRDGTTRIWEVASGKELYRGKHVEPGSGLIVGVTFCPDETCFATFGGYDIEFRKLATGESFWKLELHRAYAKALTFLANGRVMIGSGGDAPVSVWDVAKRTSVLDTSKTYSDALYSVAVSRDGSVIATAGWDYTARAWDATTGRELKRLPYGKKDASVALSPDGKLLASSGFDDFLRKQIVEITNLRPDNLIESTCRKVRRNLTAVEWREYFYDAPYHRTCPGIKSP